MADPLPPTRFIKLPRASGWGALSETMCTMRLVDRVIQDMTDAWTQADFRRVEDFLTKYPELNENPEAALRLLLEEIYLARKMGREVSRADLFQRFPQWQDQLRQFFDGDNVAAQISLPPLFPRAGEALGEFYLLTELGRGALGRVYLATQNSLSNRPVVLKLACREAQEHLSLARLQHTHIMPLHFVQEFPERNLRALCEPYLGTTTLARLLEDMRGRPVNQRTGQDILDALDRAADASPIVLPAQGPARHLFETLSYTDAICWMGARLAEALHYAHERGLVHLDLKPANILVGVDAQPYILDFDMARNPILQGDREPQWLGGTPGYMSPEQQVAFRAIERKSPVPMQIDGRSDIYSLAVVLREALAGKQVVDDSNKSHLSVGLRDILRKCLHVDPEKRYASAASLAEDLNRHLNHQRLRGVVNRSLREAWTKWRRRKPHALPLMVVIATLVGVSLAGGWIAWRQFSDRRRSAERAMFEGSEQIRKGLYKEAAETLKNGHEMAENLPAMSALRQQIEQRLHLARRGQKALELRTLADHLRFYFIEPDLVSHRVHILDASCRSIWTDLLLLVDSRQGLPGNVEEAIQEDLRDVAILWTDLRLRCASKSRASELRREAMAILDEAEQLLGPSRVLCLVRQQQADALGLADETKRHAAEADRHPPRSAWDHIALARFYWHTEQGQKAEPHLQQALALQPLAFLPRLYEGVFAYRQKRYAPAIVAFSVCVGQSPREECFYLRALAFIGEHQYPQALADLNQALQLNRTLGIASLQRGILNRRQKRYTEAMDDFRQALQNSADRANTYFHKALLQLDMGDTAAAGRSLELALRHDPQHAEAALLQRKILADR